MKKSKFTDEQIAFALRQAEAGTHPKSGTDAFGYFGGGICCQQELGQRFVRSLKRQNHHVHYWVSVKLSSSLAALIWGDNPHPKKNESELLAPAKSLSTVKTGVSTG